MNKIPVYGWNAVKLAEYLSNDELQALRIQVENDPKSANPNHGCGSIYRYTKAAERKLEALARATTFQMEQRRRLRIGAVVERG